MKPLGALIALVLSGGIMPHSSGFHAQEPKVVVQDDGVSIKRTLTVKDVSKYTVEGALSQVITLPNGMSQDMTTAVSAELELKAGDELEDDKLPFTLTVNKLKLTSTPPQKGDSKGRRITLKGLVDEQNVMSEISLQGVQKQDQAIAGLVARMAQGVGTYPCAAVKVGDTWTVSEENSFLGLKKLEYTVRYDGQQKIGDLVLYALNVKTDAPVEIDLGAMDGDTGEPGANVGMAMKGTVHVTADAFIDQFGLIHSLLFETKAEVTLDSPDANGQIKLSSDEILKIVRVADRPSH